MISNICHHRKNKILLKLPRSSMISCYTISSFLTKSFKQIAKLKRKISYILKIPQGYINPKPKKQSLFPERTAVDTRINQKPFRESINGGMKLTGYPTVDPNIDAFMYSKDIRLRSLEFIDRRHRRSHQHSCQVLIEKCSDFCFFWPTFGFYAFQYVPNVT